MSPPKPDGHEEEQKATPGTHAGIQHCGGKSVKLDQQVNYMDTLIYSPWIHKWWNTITYGM